MFNWMWLLVSQKGRSLFELDYTFGRSELNPSRRIAQYAGTPKKVSDVGLLAPLLAECQDQINSDETSEATSDASSSADTYLRVTPSSRPGEISYLINGSAGSLASSVGYDLYIRDHMLNNVCS